MDFQIAISGLVEPYPGEKVQCLLREMNKEALERDIPITTPLYLDCRSSGVPITASQRTAIPKVAWALLDTNDCLPTIHPLYVPAYANNRYLFIWSEIKKACHVLSNEEIPYKKLNDIIVSWVIFLCIHITQGGMRVVNSRTPVHILHHVGSCLLQFVNMIQMRCNYKYHPLIRTFAHLAEVQISNKCADTRAIAKYVQNIILEVVEHCQPVFPYVRPCLVNTYSMFGPSPLDTTAKVIGRR